MSKHKIKDYVTQIRGVSYKPTDVVNAEKGTPIIRANNIQNDGMIYDDLVFITPNRIKNNQILQEGDVVICTSSGSKNLVGKATTFNGYDTDVSFGAFCKGIRISNNTVNPDFIRLFFKSSIYREQISVSSTGANINNIKTEHIDNLLINIPSTEIQDIAVKELSNLISLISVKKQQQLELNELVKSRFIEMFGDPVENPKGWDKRPLLDMGTCKNGLNYRPGETGVSVHCLGVGDFKDLSVVEDVSTLSTIELAKLPSEDCMLKDDDIVFVRSNGNKALVGRCLAVYPHTAKAVHSGFCIRYRRSCNDLDTTYLLSVLKSDSMRAKMAGHGANIQNLNQKILASLDIPIPPLSLQNAFADFVNLIDKSKFVYLLNPNIFYVKFLRFRHPP